MNSRRSTTKVDSADKRLTASAISASGIRKCHSATTSQTRAPIRTIGARLAVSAAALLFLTASSLAMAEGRVECTPSTGDIRYRLFSTQNLWTVLELDTQSGQLWQLQISGPNSAASIAPVNSKLLVSGGRPGRFTLCPTGNMWNFVLLDQETGQTWQAQFSMDEKERGLMNLGPPPNGGFLMFRPSK